VRLMIWAVGISLTAGAMSPGICKPKKEQPGMQQVTPQELYNEFANNPNLKRYTQGEIWAWHACGGAEAFVTAYQVWGDTDFIDYGIKYYDGLLANMVKDPDGYYTTFGKMDDRDLWLDAEVSDALVIDPALKMAKLILQDPGLKVRYGAAADRYVAYAKKHVIEKWDKRGLWREIGEYGDYIFGTMFLKHAGDQEWFYTDQISSPFMSNKYNISNKLGLTNILLWRITGDEFYRDKAEKLFYRLKSNIQHFDGHYVWHYWNPFYEKDVYPEKNTTVHWVGVHPFRSGYQAAEVSQIVEAYHNGIVFDEHDIKCIIRTNLDLMWNGDRERPLFKNSNGRDTDTLGIGDWQKAFGHGNAQRNQGALWSALADFDPTIRELTAQGLAYSNGVRGRVERAEFDTFVAAIPVSFTRKYVKKHNLPVKVKDVPLNTSREIKIATVIPYIITPGTKAVLFSKFDTPEKHLLQIALYDRAGKNKLRVLADTTVTGDPDGLLGFHMLQWDGIDPEKKEVFKGNYLVRWTTHDGYWDCWVEVK
jgi:hypothetical protein